MRWRSLLRILLTLEGPWISDETGHAFQLKYIFLYVLLEACISITSAQTNLLMAGLIILGFSFLEEEKMSAAAFCIVLSFFIKIFGIVAFALWFLYPKKIKFLLYTVMWFVIITALPLLVVSKNDLLFQYRQWWSLLISDRDASYGASVIGLLYSWFSLNISKGWMLIAAGILFLLPFLKYAYYRIWHFRLQILASILIWIAIFNYKASLRHISLPCGCGHLVFFTASYPNK